jgi:hypothetical protein
MNHPVTILKNFSVLTFLFAPILAGAQTATVASGGDAVSGSGSVSYSIGQIAVGNTTTPMASVNEGIQQPYEFFTVHIDEPLQDISISLFPNPTLSEVVIQIPSSELDLTASFFSSDGNLVQQIQLAGARTAVNMSDWSASTYLVQITNSKGNTAAYKLIKH